MINVCAHIVLYTIDWSNWSNKLHFTHFHYDIFLLTSDARSFHCWRLHNFNVTQVDKARMRIVSMHVEKRWMHSRTPADRYHCKIPNNFPFHIFDACDTIIAITIPTVTATVTAQIAAAAAAVWLLAMLLDNTINIRLLSSFFCGIFSAFLSLSLSHRFISVCLRVACAAVCVFV